MEKSAEHVDNADEQKLEIAQMEGITFQAALEISKPNPWAKGYLHMYTVCALIFLCSTMNGGLIFRIEILTENYLTLDRLRR